MAKKMWGGRFKKEIDRDFFLFQKSIQYDHKLAEYDVYHSIIHTLALVYTGVLTAEEGRLLHSALKSILAQIRQGKFKYNPASEDIHTEIQNRLEKNAGPVALKIHAFRSRNDQVAFDERYYCLAQGGRLFRLILDLRKSLIGLAQEYQDNFFIGYTHTQRAQIIKFSDYLLGYMEMFISDSERLFNYLENLRVYIGSGALAGSYIKKEDYARAIKECADKIFADLPQKISSGHSSLNNVSNRDFVIELLSLVSILQMHLSRMAEDFILYSTQEFNYFDLPEEFCTGSSLMPHKKNPDFLELVRGNTGRIYGNLVAVLTMMKALPLTYNRDMQLDKEPLFSSLEIIIDELRILSAFIPKIKLNEKVVNKALEDESLYATEIAEYLVNKGVPFRKAHAVVGNLIRYCQDNNIRIKNMTDDPLKNFSQYLRSAEINKIIQPGYVVNLKRSLSDPGFLFRQDGINKAKRKLSSLERGTYK